MLIYGVSGIFVDKKIIKQFLQPMTKQVLGGGGGVLLFLRQFFRATVFLCQFFSIYQCLLGSILPIFAYFCCMLCVFHQKVKQCQWGQNFRDVQLIPNFLRYPACLILQFLEGVIGNKLPNRWILIQQ